MLVAACTTSVGRGLTDEWGWPDTAQLCLCHCSLQLPASGVDVSAPGSAYEGRYAGLNEHPLEFQNTAFAGSAKGNAWHGIQRNQVHLGANAPDSLSNFSGLLD